jgi:hypothetical protein
MCLQRLANAIFRARFGRAALLWFQRAERSAKALDGVISTLTGLWT